MKVDIESYKILRECTPEQRMKIMDDLSILNPAYVSAKKFTSYSSISIPMYLNYYTKTKNELIVPRGYKIPFKHTIEYDDRFTLENVEYPKFKLKLRDTQKEAYNAYIKSREKGDGVIVLPTGKGKSILGLFLASQLRQKALIIVHKDDLVDGWKKDAKLALGLRPKQVGIIKAKEFRIGKQITITTIQTLAKLPPATLSELKKEFSMIIVDECLVGDTLIVKGDGGWERIKNIKNGDKIIGGEVSDRFSLKSLICKVTSPFGSLEGSYTHPTFYIPNNAINKKGKNHFTDSDLRETVLFNIEEGDLIPIIKSIPHTTKYNWTPEQLSFVALIMADGHIDKQLNSRRVKVNVTNDKEWYREVFYRGAKAFNVREIKESTDCRGNLTLWINSRRVKRILTSVFEIPVGKKSDKILINKQIQYAPILSIKAFIETFISCEGDLTYTGNSCRLTFNITSKDFAEGFQLLIRKFSILTTLSTILRKNEKHSTIYRLSFGGKFFNDFMSNFSLLNRKHTWYRNEGKNNFYHETESYILARVIKTERTEREEEVYDFTTTSHTFIANGILTHNCHHTPARTFEVSAIFPAYDRIGLTATDMRNDGLGRVINYYLGEVCYRYEENDNDEDIIAPNNVFVNIKETKVMYNPPTEYTLPNHTDPIDYFYYQGQRLQIDEMNYDEIEWFINSRIIRRKPLNYSKVMKAIWTNENYTLQVTSDIIKEYKNSKSILVLCIEKEHCRLLEEVLIGAGVPEETIQLYYGDATESKSTMKTKAEKREALITIATYSIAKEGTNVKPWERVFLAMTVNNELDTIQAIGRGRRKCKGKEELIVYDYSHPNVKGAKNHIDTRRKVYKERGFTVKDYSSKQVNYGITRGLGRKAK